VLLGESMVQGVKNLNVGTGNGASAGRAALKVQAAHYVTVNYTVGNNYTITPTNNAIDYHASFTGTNVLSLDNNDARGVVVDGSNVITYGPERPDLFTADGDTFGIRVIDHALNSAK
ncbi:MAG: hypothetical protein M1530_00420, partial [Candidatus Marsarchaeota archaeon]|nr:hypothetical protein [Candidatus Marsarchaeota archaeon]